MLDFYIAPLPAAYRRKWISESSSLYNNKKEPENPNSFLLAQKERLELSRRFPGLRP